MPFPAGFTSACTDAQIKARLAGLLKVSDESTMQSWVDAIVKDAHEAAVNEIVGTLVGRGYDMGSVIQQWDRLGEFTKAIAVWWCAAESGAFENFEGPLLKKLDRRAELEEIDITVAGQLILPGSGQIQIGRGDNTPVPQSTRQGFDGFGSGQTWDNGLTRNGPGTLGGGPAGW